MVSPFIFCAMLVGATNGGLGDWTVEARTPVRGALFVTKPDPEHNHFGKVLPAFANPTAFSASKHPLLALYAPQERAWLEQLVTVGAQPKGELAFVNAPKPTSFFNAELPIGFLSLSEVALTPTKSGKPKVERVKVQQCCEEDGPKRPFTDIGLTKTYPARVVRDAEGRVRALVRHSESFISEDHHGRGPVTERNAAAPGASWELTAFDESGRLTGLVRFARSDNELRYLPYLALQAYTVTWGPDGANTIRGVVMTDDGDGFELNAHPETWTHRSAH